MSSNHDFDIVDERAQQKRGPRFGLWLTIVLALVIFGFAVGLAFSRISSRFVDTPPAINDPVVAEVGPTQQPVQEPVEDTSPAEEDSPPTTTPQPSSTPTATRIPTPTPQASATCARAVDPQFTGETASLTLGCPISGPESIAWAAWEPFEFGSMLWRSDTNAAYIFLSEGRWLQVEESWDNEPVPSRGDPPPGLRAPERGFGYAWGIRDDYFRWLGWATDSEKGICIHVQDFEQGFLVKSANVPSCTSDGLYNHASSADWAPLSLVAEAARDIESSSDDLSATAPAAASGDSPAVAAGLRPPENGLIRAPFLVNLESDADFADWPDSWITLDRVVYNQATYSGPTDLSGRFQLAWSDQGLHIAIEVRDQRYRPGPNGSTMWRGDGLEIHFDRELAADFRRAEADRDDYQIGIGYDAALSTLRGYRWLPFELERSFRPQGNVVPWRDGGVPAGYRAEFVLPWTLFEVTPAELSAGAGFGFNLSINDNDGNRPRQETLISAAPQRTTHDDPTEWSTLLLE